MRVCGEPAGLRMHRGARPPVSRNTEEPHPAHPLAGLISWRWAQGRVCLRRGCAPGGAIRARCAGAGRSESIRGNEGSSRPRDVPRLGRGAGGGSQGVGRRGEQR